MHAVAAGTVALGSSKAVLHVLLLVLVVASWC
jgi:hypothetical protein